MNRKTYKPSDFNEWTIVHYSGVMALPGSPRVDGWLEKRVNSGEIIGKPYPLAHQFKMYDLHGAVLFRYASSSNKEKQPDICEFCGRFEPCVNVFGNMFCEDIPTCTLFRAMSNSVGYLTRTLTNDHEWTLNLIRQSNLTRLPNKWREWAERQIAINDYHKGEL